MVTNDGFTNAIVDYVYFYFSSPQYLT
jgi:hypothetical protein